SITLPSQAYFDGTAELHIVNAGIDDGPSLTTTVYDVGTNPPTSLYTTSAVNPNVTLTMPSSSDGLGSLHLVVEFTDSVGQAVRSSERVITLTQRPIAIAFDQGGDPTANPSQASVSVASATLRVLVADSAARPIPYQTVAFTSQQGGGAVT